MCAQLSSRRLILVVDDVGTVRAWATSVLSGAGHRVLATDEPTRLTSLLVKHRPVLVLLDVSMPDVDGDKLVRMAKGASHRPLVVLHSSKPEAELEVLSRCSGADGFIKKTSNPVTFLAQVSAYLRRCY
jgi:twitching motility two-component system response regulator PilG